MRKIYRTFRTFVMIARVLIYWTFVVFVSFIIWNPRYVLCLFNWLYFVYFLLWSKTLKLKSSYGSSSLNLSLYYSRIVYEFLIRLNMQRKYRIKKRQRRINNNFLKDILKKIARKAFSYEVFLTHTTSNLYKFPFILLP